jgi:hypothetical protein
MGCEESLASERGADDRHWKRITGRGCAECFGNWGFLFQALKCSQILSARAVKSNIITHFSFFGV